MEINKISQVDIQPAILADLPETQADGNAVVKDFPKKSNVVLDNRSKPGVLKAFDEESSEKIIDKAIEQANKKLMISNRMLSYSYHEKTRRVVVKVLDASTKEIIREIPPEKELDAYAKILEMAGLMVDKKS